MDTAGTKTLYVSLLLVMALLGILVFHTQNSTGLMATQTPPIPAAAIRHNNLGVALMDTGPKDPEYFPEAIKEFQSALQITPNYLTARINIGMAYYYAGQREKGVTTLQAALKDAPDNLYISYMLGLIQETFGNYEEARAYFLKVAKADPADSKTWYHIGNCYSKEQQYTEAITPLKKAADLEPYQRLFRYNLFMALNRAGKAEEAQKELASFQQLEQSSVKVAPAPKSSLEYLRQGKYAEAIAESLPETPVPATHPQYTNVAPLLGVRFPQEGSNPDPEIQKILRGEPVAREWYENAGNRTRLMTGVSAGTAFCDYNNDGKLDLFLLGPNGQYALFEQQVNGQFNDVTIKAGLTNLPKLGMNVTWGDYDNDGWSDLFIAGYADLRLYHNNKGSFQDVTSSSGISQAVRPSVWYQTSAFADVDHDGDLDIYVGGLADLATVPGKAEICFPADFPGQSNLLFRNNSDGTFAEISQEAKVGGGNHHTRGIWFSDVNLDRAIDLVLFDVAGKASVYLNESDGTFSLTSQTYKNLPQAPPLGVSRSYGDFNGDGSLDELLLRNGGPALLNRNDAKPQNWLKVQLVGYAVPGKVKSNKLGVGTKVEIRSVGRWEIQELHAGNSVGGCDSAEVYFDLGDQTRMDFVRAVFPSGVRKTLKDIPANQTVKLEEPLLDVNSCPTVFAWNGRRFEFIADTISAGILGELVAPAQYSQPDADEWLRVRSEQLRPSPTGSLDLRWANPLEEVTYLDQVRLLAVDHPAHVEVYANERMVNEPRNLFPIQLYGVTQIRPIVKATDQTGHDVTPALMKADRIYFDHYTPLPFKGFAKDWSLKLDLGPIDRSQKPVLLLNAWSYWNSSASVIAASQAGKKLWGPVLEVLSNDGRWRLGTDDMGVSPGLPRTILVDLTPYLKPGEHVVRIRSNRTLYYDQILVANRADSRAIADGASGFSLLKTRELPLLTGQLRWLGYPKRQLPDGKLPEVFDYDQVEAQAEWGTHEGMLTRFGEVLPLLKKADDRFVVMEHGEEVALKFDATPLTTLPAGWKRTFFFYSNGFEKGYEMHSARALTVDPLPFQEMEGYPPDRIRSLTDTEYWEYLLDWNTRPSYMRR